MKRLLILVPEYEAYSAHAEWHRFPTELQGRLADVSVKIAGLRNLIYTGSDHHLDIYSPALECSINGFDLVAFRSVRREQGRAAACAQFLTIHGVPYIDSLRQPAYYTKLSSSFARVASGIPVVPFLSAPPDEMHRSIQEGIFALPVILKSVRGRRGQHNFFVRDMQTLGKVLASNPDVDFLLQRYIPNDGDYRCLVLGGQLRLLIKRQAASGSHLTNTSQGGRATLMPLHALPTQVIRDVERAARLERCEVAGVDLIIDRETKKHYILEVNTGPQLLSGAFPEEKMQEYAAYIKSLLIL